MNGKVVYLRQGDKQTLKPCPFCGGKTRIRRYRTYVEEYTGIANKYYGTCTVDSNHDEEYPLGYLSMAEAVEAWNRRV